MPQWNKTRSPKKSTRMSLVFESVWETGVFKWRVKSEEWISKKSPFLRMRIFWRRRSDSKLRLNCGSRHFPSSKSPRSLPTAAPWLFSLLPPPAAGKKGLKRLELLSPGTGFFRRFSLFSPWRAAAHRRLKKKKSLENFSVAGACSFYSADFWHDDKRAAVNTVVFARFLRKSGRKSSR